MPLRTGRAHRYTVFSTAIVDVELSIHATDGDQGCHLILYEHRSGALQLELDKRVLEKDVL